MLPGIPKEEANVDVHPSSVRLMKELIAGAEKAGLGMLVTTGGRGRWIFPSVMIRPCPWI
ncbi:hypothetical protein KBB96_09255 [Luteolibacter ambystomatis]|uniref:Uncharacterized protein n=1 Tax=Luteolibacter ambystomatis TaxID=2824561 RepID=A0A975PGZ0_9BACT|nr:hypothetical protein [Luteolibacter ambystomatis]QUE53065.1 hypothetical protein KBB96_09255 [Luteolibacter ambystomatis]